MPKTNYVARLNGEIVGKRASASGRFYSHAVIVDQPLGGWRESKGRHAIAWCSRTDLAAREAAKASKYFAFVTVVEAELVPSNARTAKALNDSGVFAPFTCVGKD